MANSSTAHNSELFSGIQDAEAQILQGGQNGQQIPPDVLVSRGFLGLLLLDRVGTTFQYLISLKKPMMPWT